jgi:L-ascorbate metabolism protein UlaG (beta-lactamase superfamily)
MKIQKLGHACLVVEQGDGKLLIDPGIFASDFTGLTDLTGVLITHQHADHVDQDRLLALLDNYRVPVYADPQTAEQLADKGIKATAVHAGETLDLGITVQVFGEQHAVIHADVPRIGNVCYLVADTLFHPGDSFTVPGVPVGVLALPAAAPWMKSAEAVDYLRAVAPPVAVPIHDAMLIPQAKPLVYGLFERLAPSGTQVRTIDDGAPVEV